jgi:hypothetical protein
MKARQFFANTSYDPDQLKALGEAFDGCWDCAHTSGEAASTSPIAATKVVNFM